MLSLVRVQRSASATLARVYYRQFSLLETGEPTTFGAPPEFPEDAVRESLYATGRGKLAEHLRAGADRAEAVDLAGRDVAGAMMRHTLNGARDVLADAFTRDRRAVGWVRVTREGCCYFCAMLASRGHVYREQSFDASDPRFRDGVVPSDHKVHDNCRCFLEPVYSRSAALPGRAEQFDGLWKKTTTTFSGWEKALAFRRAYEALLRGEGEEQAIDRALRRERVVDSAA